jgi:hypothetical protein
MWNVSAFVMAICFLVAPACMAGSARLKWTCPNCVADGVASFAIRYGQSTQALIKSPPAASDPAPYEKILSIDDPSVLTAVIDDLIGVWYFRLTAIDAAGNESLFTPEIAIDVKVSTPKDFTGGSE